MMAWSKTEITLEEVSPVLCVNSEKGRLPPKLFAKVWNFEISGKPVREDYMWHVGSNFIHKN